MSASDVLIRAQELSGTWTAIGSGLARGIVVDDLNLDADSWGPRSAQFVLKRSPQAIWPDISAFTPVEIEIGGIVVWEGRVKETPSKDGADRQMSVSCEGWQYHLDDDPFKRIYAHSGLADWADTRSMNECPLASYTVAGQVQVGPGVISLMWAKTAPPVAAASFAGVYLDFGSSLCKRVVLSYTSSNNDATTQLYCRGSDERGGNPVVFDDAFFVNNNGGAAAVTAGTFATAHRYVYFFMYTGTAIPAPAADIWFRLNAILAFPDTAYESGNNSILKASDVVKDARSRATLLLSSDTSKIQSTSFSIPDFNMTTPGTPREAINAVNAYHAWQPRITRNKLLEYRPLPSTALFSADDSGGIEFSDASANSGLDIYSGVTVNYTSPDGIASSAARSQPATISGPSLIQPTNSSAAVDTSNWTTTGSGTFSRTTTAGEFTTAPGGFKSVGPAISPNLVASTSAWTGGTFVPGQSYKLALDLRIDVAAAASVSVRASDGTLLAAVTPTPAGAFVATELSWVQKDASAPSISVSVVRGTAYFDSIQLLESAPTLVNRRGFRRTKILDTNMALSAAAAQQIGDVYLTGHKTTPFKGSINVNGSAAISLAQGGVMVPPWHLLYNTGELVRLPHLIDPDTGGLGREGRIAVISCNPITGVASIDLDNQRTNFEALLSRLSIVTGQIATPA